MELSDMLVPSGLVAYDIKEQEVGNVTTQIYSVSNVDDSFVS